MALFGATKIMTKNENRAQMAGAGAAAIPNPGSYMEASRKVYFEQHQQEHGSIFSQKLTEAQQAGGHEGTQGAATHRAFAPKQTTYLRGLKFGGIMNRFLTLRESQVANRRARLALYLMPASLAFLGAATNYINQHFVIYLRYQALVDEHYWRGVAKKEAAAKPE